MWFFLFFKQRTAYDMRISDWSSDVCSSDLAGQDLPQGESGEIAVRGPQVTPGYWNRPEETRKTFDPDGFLRTGDIGYVNEKGYVFIQDRKKDMILVSGFNVYPNEEIGRASCRERVCQYV